MELKERPLMRLKFAKVSRPYLLFWRGELVAVYPLGDEITAVLFSQQSTKEAMQ